MSTASHYAEIRARFFPQARPIVRGFIPPPSPPRALVPPSEADVMIVAYRVWTEKQREAHRLAVLASYDEGYAEGCRASRQLAPPSGGKQADNIIEFVLLRYNVSWAELTGRGRSKPIVAARRAAATAMRKELGMSYPAIGKKLNRDHSSIMGLLSRAVGQKGGAC